MASEAPTSVTAAVDLLRRELERALVGRYEVVRILGRGGMGAVYLARESALDRMVAIKVLHPPEASAGAADGHERFRREARTAAKLTHPNIVPLHMFGEAEGLLYVVMGYVRGESLADRLRREGRLPPDDVRRILIELADALDYAHRHGVVHRDVKPDNILLEDESGRAMLTDFGIARAVELGGAAGGTLTTTGAFVGTPQYMSPEQANAEKTLDGRSDLYSLGVVGYAMLTGRPPFSGHNAWAVLAEHAAKAPAPLAGVAPGVPEDLASAVMKCLEKNPAQRWPDGRRLRQALATDISDEDALPYELQRTVGGGIALLITLVTVGTPVWVATLLGGKLGPYSWWMIALLPLLGLPTAVSLARSARRSGHSWRRILRVTFWQPKWWPFWWPRALSRPGDLWPRLPRSLRLLRIAFSIGVALQILSVLMLLQGFLETGPAETRLRHAENARVSTLSLEWLSQLRMIALLLPAGGAILVSSIGLLLAPVAVVLWGRGRGLNWDTATDLLFKPMSSPFWKRPEIAGFLQGLSVQGGKPDRREPHAPHELLGAIAEIADQLTGPVRALGSDALGVARRVVANLEALDRELGGLARSADPAELARLERRLAILDADRAEETEEQRRMRGLLSDQLELIRRLRARLDAATTRRAHLISMLRTLWLHLAELRAQNAREVDMSAEVTAPVRELCAEIGRRVDAGVEIERLLVAESPTRANGP